MSKELEVIDERQQINALKDANKKLADFAREKQARVAELEQEVFLLTSSVNALDQMNTDLADNLDAVQRIKESWIEKADALAKKVGLLKDTSTHWPVLMEQEKEITGLKAKIASLAALATERDALAVQNESLRSAISGLLDDLVEVERNRGEYFLRGDVVLAATTALSMRSEGAEKP